MEAEKAFKQESKFEEVKEIVEGNLLKTMDLKGEKENGRQI